MSELTINVTKTPVYKSKSKQKQSKDDIQVRQPKGNFESKGRSGFAKKPFKRKYEDDEDRDESDAEEVDDHGNHFKSDKSEKQEKGTVSSLFRSNPEMPFIAHKDVKPVSEAVFSSKNVRDLPIHPFAISNLEQNMGVTKVTTVQQMSFPVIASGKDALIRSQTGSGKTLAYALPIVEALHNIRPKLQRSDGVRAVVVVPTRELALQTYECFLKLVKPFTWIVPGYLVGGEKRKAEKARLRKGIAILVGTPGRLLDHIMHTESLVLDHVKWLIIDEADRLLDMGYEKDVASLIRALNGQQYGNPDGEKERFHPLDTDAPEINPKTVQEPSEIKRQTILLSATLTSAVDRLAGLTLKHPKFVDAAVVANEDGDSVDMELIEQDLVIPETLSQWYILTPAKLRLVTLASFIVWKCRMTDERKMLVFMATQDMVDFHTEILSSVLGTREKKTGVVDEDSDLEDEYGLLQKKDVDDEDEDDPSLVDIEFFKLHGNMTQKERTDVFRTFRDATSGVLLCTDVAARGLDLPLVDWIVQYTAPATAADYVHRVGRTARVGSAGSAMIMLSPSECGFINQLEERSVRIQEERMDMSLKCLVPTMAVSDPTLLRMRSGAVETAATQLQLRFEEAVVSRQDLHDMAAKAYVSFVRFYASYPREARTLFNFKALHLGHFAKSFALRDPPSQIGGLGKKQKNPRDRSRQDQQRPRGGPGSSRGSTGGRGNPNKKPSPFGTKVSENRTMKIAASEFASGLAPRKKKQKVENMSRFD